MSESEGVLLVTASTTLVLVAIVTCGLINDHKFSRRVSGTGRENRSSGQGKGRKITREEEITLLNPGKLRRRLMIWAESRFANCMLMSGENAGP